MSPVGSSLRESQRLAESVVPTEGEDALRHLLAVTARVLRAPSVTLLECCGSELRSRAFAGSQPSAAVERLCREVASRRAPLVVESLATNLCFRSDPAGEAAEAAGFVAVPLLDAAGEVRGVLAALDRGPREWTDDDVESLRDLAAAVGRLLEREALERAHRELAVALAQSEARCRRVAEASSGLVFSLDSAGCITEINAAGAELLGLPVEAALGRCFLDLVAPEDRELANDVVGHAADAVPTRTQVEVHLLRDGGERRLLQVSISPLLRDGATGGVFGVARDVTDDRARELQYRRVERMASVAPLLGGICHELNNPLTSIKSFAELLLMDPRSTEDQEALEIVQREAHRAAKIVSDLRVVARQSQEVGVSRTQVDVNRVVERVLELRQEALAAAEITVLPRLAPGLPPAWAVPPHLEQVVLQLVVNAEQALQASGMPRELVVRTFRGNKGVGLQVHDNGPGIPAAHFEHIFDPFWTTKSPGQGTGLGLSLVHSMVTDHGGLIRVDSAPGCGASFTVEIPCLEASAVAPNGGEVEQAASRALRVLVVDDEAPIRHSLGRYMRRRGHHVDEATEGGAALEALERAGADAPYDVIVADLRMPGLDGERLFERLRERGDGMEQRLVFITGDADSPDAVRVLEAAGVPVVQKPFELAEIAQVLEAQAGMTTL